MSIILNYIEGYARKKKLVVVNFYETSYGSLKESKYLLHFALTEKWISAEEYKRAIILVEEIGAILWRTLEMIDRQGK